ncbi:MAG: cytochrome c oxidase subunit II [Gammaproteobacteria bacterium]|nr:cytochrome c oxidase subunit II [Gammaproteobacteria bacterium]
MIAPALAEWEVNLMPGVTQISRDTYELHMIVFWICVAIAIVVFGAMFYSLFKFRRSQGAVPDTTMVHSTRMEIIWTIIPIAILVAMAIPAAETLVKIEDTRSPDLSIKVTGYQWKWHYEYLGNVGDPLISKNFGFYSNLTAEANRARQLGSGADVFELEHYLRDVDKRVVVPVNKKVRILLTSNDVLHAWWVPELGGKRDAIPGFVNEMWFQAEETGVYRGQCAELCGYDHGFMPIVVEVVEEEAFNDWVSEQGGAVGMDEFEVGGVAEIGADTAEGATVAAGGGNAAAGSSAAADLNMSMEDLMALGETTYNTHCIACHQANGEGLPPAFPSLVGSPVATGPAAGHIDVLLNGVSGSAMVAFTYLSNQEIAAVITYERNAWGNDVGDMVQPADVAAAR